MVGVTASRRSRAALTPISAVDSAPGFGFVGSVAITHEAIRSIGVGLESTRRPTRRSCRRARRPPRRKVALAAFSCRGCPPGPSGAGIRGGLNRSPSSSRRCSAMCRHVQSDVIGQLEGAPSGGRTRSPSLVDVGRAGDALFDHPDRLESQREAESRGGEAGRVPDDDIFLSMSRT